MIGRMAARFAGVRAVVYTAHAFPFHKNLSRIGIWCYAALERLAASWCDRIVVDTECVKARGLQFKIASENHFRVIPMGVDTERFNPEKYREQRAAIRLELGLKPDAFLVGAIARFVQGKGLEYLLRALEIITDRFQDTQCLLVGDGELRDELHRLAKSLGLDGRVVFAGYQRDTPRCLAAMDLFVLPTFREGFGVVFAEAMSMEVPVVGSRISPLTEIIVDGETGLLAEAGNVQAIAQATMSLVDDSDRCRKMGRAGRRHVVANFSQAQMCLAYERIFLECLSRSLTGDLKGKAFSR